MSADLTPEDDPHISKKICPFCLGIYKTYQFDKTLKSGKLAKNIQCPECKKDMRRETLNQVNQMTTEEFAQWTADYSEYGFWKMIDFDLFSKRLRLRGQSAEFWGFYRKYKPKKETEEERIERQAREYEESLKDGSAYGTTTLRPDEKPS